ncbi:outer membrane protein [Planoprotostelium fungivorum]|uniref:Outer membrane protein n=1 Tax=Planoprotostelium fungivorum TaxID=1890364 RepID=A0A2P6NA31_9EUKA|nr:outer membrane protein [Planoprotostelium fungivorum]
MNIKSAILLLTVATLAAGQIQASGNVAANTATTLPFSNTGLPIFNPLVTVLPSLNVTSSTAGKITITVNTASVNTILTSAQSTGFAGGLNVDANGNLGGVFANAAFTGSLTGATNLFGSISNALSSLSLAITFTDGNNNPAATTLTISGSFGTLAASGTLQVGLFASANDYTAVNGNSGSASANANVYGAVPYSISAGGQTYTYTLNIPASGSLNNIFIKPFDPTQAKASNNGATAASSGSSSFSTASFVPVALGYDFNLQGGQQYAFGNNIQVTPSASSGSTAGTLNVKFNGLFNGAVGGNASASHAPNAASGSTSNYVFLSGSYQFTGSNNANNVIQFTSAPSTTNNLFTNATAGANAAATVSTTAVGQAINAGKLTLSWFKSTATGAAETGATWVKVASTSTYDATAGVKVYATVSSYSQWTVASADAGSGTNSTSVSGTVNPTGNNGVASGLQYTLATLLFSALLLVAF